MRNLQARISSLGHVLSLAKTSEITPELTNQLIRNEIVPLQTSLSKAETRLSKHEREDMRLFCHVVGIKTLIACYLYLGESVPSLQKDLEDSIYVFQKRLLDSIAQSNREIPWNKIPYLLTTDGVSELVELYNSTLQDNKKISSIESISIASKDPNESLKSSPIVKKSPTVKKRKVRDMNLQNTTRTARKLHGPFFLLFSCSECGFNVHADDFNMSELQKKICVRSLHL